MMKIGLFLSVCLHSVMCIQMTKFSHFYGWVHLHDGSASLKSIGDQTQQTCATLCVTVDDNEYDNDCSMAEFNIVSKYCTLFFWKDVKMLMVPNNKTNYMDTVVMVKRGNKRKLKVQRKKTKL